MVIVNVDSELKDILPGFIENRIKDIEALTKALAENDFSTIEKIGHRVSGSSGGYGFGELGKIAKEIESNCKEGKFEKIPNLVRDFKSFMDNVEIQYI